MQKKIDQIYFNKKVREYVRNGMSDEQKECETCGYLSSKERAEFLFDDIIERSSRAVGEKLLEYDWERTQMQVETEEFMFEQGARYGAKLIVKMLFDKDIDL